MHNSRLDRTPSSPYSPQGGPADLPTPGSAHRIKPATHRRGLKRSSAACQRCRRRKQKCDGKAPICGPCASAGEVCIPSERLVIRTDTDVECEQLRAQVAQLQEKVALLQGRVRNTHSHFATAEDGAGQGTSAYRSNALIPGRRGSIINNDVPRTHVQVGYHGRMLFPTFRVGGPATRDSGFLSSPWHLWDGLASVGGGPDETSRVDRVLLCEVQRRELVDTFFYRRWPQFPVLHKPTFLEQHYEPFTRNEATNGLSAFLVNIVLAIGSSEKIRTNAPCEVPHQTFFEAAVQDLGDVLSADDLDCIQCLLLICMYGSNEPQSVNLWYTVGLTLRLVLGIDLHRHESLLNKTFMEQEMMKRLFWSIYSMDRSISIAMGRPLGMQDTDITMPLPLSLSDEMLLAQDRAGGGTGGGDMSFVNLGPEPGDLSTFLHIIQLRRINGSIYKTLYSAGDTSLTADNVEALRSQYYGQLNQWLVSIPRYINPVCMNQTPEWFQIAYHQAIMNLYRPSHASPICTMDAIRLCADSAISLITNYSSLYAKNRITYTFVALTSVFMAAVTMLYCLRASATLRSELTREVVEWNIRMCTTLLRDMSNNGVVGERSAQIVQRLGDATLAVFDAQCEPVTVEANVTTSGVGARVGADRTDGTVAGGEVDEEFMSWFGLKSRHLPLPVSSQGQPTPSVDLPWNDLFDDGFEFGGSWGLMW